MKGGMKGGMGGPRRVREAVPSAQVSASSPERERAPSGHLLLRAAREQTKKRTNGKTTGRWRHTQTETEEDGSGIRTCKHVHCAREKSNQPTRSSPNRTQLLVKENFTTCCPLGDDTT